MQARSLVSRRHKRQLFRPRLQHTLCTQCAMHSAQTRPSRPSRTHQPQRSQHHTRHNSPPGCSARIQQRTVRRSRPYRRSLLDTPRRHGCQQSAECRRHSACRSLLCQSIPLHMASMLCCPVLALCRPRKCCMNRQLQQIQGCKAYRTCIRGSAQFLPGTGDRMVQRLPLGKTCCQSASRHHSSFGLW